MSNRGRHYYIIISVNTNGHNSEVKQTTPAVPLWFSFTASTEVYEKHFKCIVNRVSAETGWFPSILTEPLRI